MLPVLTSKTELEKDYLSLDVLGVIRGFQQKKKIKKKINKFNKQTFRK